METHNRINIPSNLDVVRESYDDINMDEKLEPVPCIVGSIRDKRRCYVKGRGEPPGPTDRFRCLGGT